MTRKIEAETYQRTMVLERDSVNADDRTVTAALSSETPVDRFFGQEVLVHENSKVNMERASDGLPLLWAHDHAAPIGRIEDIRIDDDKKMRGQLRFSQNARATEIWNDVRDGFLRDVSIGYRIDKYEIDEQENPDLVRVTRWTPLEGSIVTVPADASVGVNRQLSQEVTTAMATEDENTGAGGDAAGGQGTGGVTGELRLLRMDKQRERRVGAQAERDRISAIDDLFDRYEARFGEGSFSDLKQLCIDNIDIDAERAKGYIDEAILDGHVSVNVATRQDAGSAFTGLPKFSTSARVGMGEEQGEKFARAAELALSIRAGAVVEEKDRKEAIQGPYLSMTPTELAREYLRINGQSANGTREQVIGQALKYGQREGISHGTGHFASVLENVANKSMLEGFMEAEQTFAAWTQARSIPDFKTTSLLNLSLFSGLEEVKEGAQYTHGDMSDIKETIKLVTYGRLFTISRQALANDDLSALGDIPRAMGSAASRKVGDVVYEVLTTGTSTTMLQDGVALFNEATHSNNPASGGPPSVATMDTARTAMATQTDPQGATLGIRPAYLIVPIALETTADTLIAATYDPAGTAGTLKPNPFQNSVSVIADHRLDANSAAVWYLAARTNTVSVGYLNGQQTPFLESKDGWNVDGVEYKVRMDAAATATDFRGLYRNVGA